MDNSELNENDFTVSGNFVYVKNVNSPGMLFIHANWCGHCKRFMPIFKNLQKKLGKNFPCLSIENNELEKANGLSSALNIEYFPTIKFFDQYGKIINTYPDNLTRDEKSINKYICEVYHHCIEKH